MTESACPRCHTTTQPGDQICANCGEALLRIHSHDHATPIPGASAPPDVSSRTKRLARPPWYRRKRVMIPLVLLVLLGAAIGGSLAYINARFDMINSLSTPPAVITGSQLGGDEGLIVNTGPAQDAVRRAQQGEPVATATTAPDLPADQQGLRSVNPSGDSYTLMTFGMQREVTPVPDAGTATPTTIQMPPADPGTSINVLLMGVDARPGEAIDIGVRPDTLAVLNLDPETGSCRILAIPRDSRVELPGYGPSKVNHALAIGGVPYQMLVVENLLGIEFDHYGLIDFAGAEGIVDELGGITVVNDRAFSYEGHEFGKGEMRLNGEEALAYVRFRGDEEGDFGRQERQQQVVRAMLSEGADLDVVTAIPQLLDAIENHVRTDAGPDTLIDLGREFHSTCTAETLDAKRINGEIAMLHDVIFNEPLSFVVLDKAEVAVKLDWLLTGKEPPNATPEASPVVIRKDLPKTLWARPEW